jgi:hypothetical protein
MDKKDKIKVYKSTNDFFETTLIPQLTIDELYEFAEDSKIDSQIDRQIADLILAAETDWIITVYNLNDFLVILERESNGDTTRDNLEKLLQKYNSRIERHSWESESLSTLLHIFDLVEGKTLRQIFFDFSKRVSNQK